MGEARPVDLWLVAIFRNICLGRVRCSYELLKLARDY